MPSFQAHINVRAAKSDFLDAIAGLGDMQQPQVRSGYGRCLFASLIGVLPDVTGI